MTTDDTRILLAQRELDEAAREWAAAQLLAQQGFFRQAVTRAYFAAFHAAQGLLSAHGLQAATHEGVQRLIGLHFVMTGLMPKEAGRALSALLARRHEADYRLVVDVDESTWKAARSEAQTVAAAIGGHLAAAWPQLKFAIDLGQP
ncbi:MAG: HEPN domain-containing protein [Burkholderiaceae bacterium]